MKVRQASSSLDWAEVRRICCATGAVGRPIARERDEFFGKLWIGPYERLEPRWTYVLEESVTATGPAIRGYLTGCADTPAFLRRRPFAELELWGRALAAELRWAGIAPTVDTRRFLRWRLGLEPTPERRFGRSVMSQVYERFPAHLHVNLDESARGQGGGRSLIEHYRQELRKQSVSGIHLICGARAREFYGKIGFEMAKSVEASPGVPIFLMTSELGPSNL